MAKRNKKARCGSGSEKTQVGGKQMYRCTVCGRLTDHEIEVCSEECLDEDERRYIADMEQAYLDAIENMDIADEYYLSH